MVQSAVMKNQHWMGGKLDDRWTGPYEVLEKMSKGRYCLKTKERSKRSCTMVLYWKTTYKDLRPSRPLLLQPTVSWCSSRWLQWDLHWQGWSAVTSCYKELCFLILCNQYVIVCVTYITLCNHSHLVWVCMYHVLRKRNFHNSRVEAIISEVI